MWSMFTSSVCAHLVLFMLGTNAQTSLWIPGLDPQPISASVLGVGSDGRTTWEIQQGTPTGTFTDTGDFGFPGTATLIEGSSNAVLSAVVSTEGFEVGLGQSCTIAGGVATCIGEVSMGSTVSSGTTTQVVSSIVVQAGGAASPTGSTQSAGGSNQASAGSSPTATGAQATGTKNAVDRLQVTGDLLWLGLVGSIISFVL